MDFFHLLFGFNGRITRVQYWLGNVVAGICGATLLFALGAIFTPAVTDPKAPPEAPGAMAAFIFAGVMFLMSWCGLALQVKRFHDRGRSGYWAMAPLVPVTMIVVTIASNIAAGAPAHIAVAQVIPWLGVMMLINLWLLIDLGMLPGTSGPNKYDHTPGGPSGGGLGLNLGGGAAKASTSAASIFGGAQAAMDRAIAQQAAPASAPPPSADSQWPAPPRSASFGRRSTR